MPVQAQEALCRRIGYQFADAGLLVEALTHRSASRINNERFEFLGDSLLGLIVGESLFRSYPAADEGQLTRERARLVKRETLAALARELDLGSLLRLGEGELKSGGWRRESILANALEALVAAVYLDGGMAACESSVAAIYNDWLTAASPHDNVKDAKTRLQEYMQAKKLDVPEYTIVEVTGAPHEQEFTVRCSVAHLEAIVGTGSSRRRAEQAAATLALEKLGVD